MSKTKITLHIFTSVDGKITGTYSEVEECKPAIKIFESTGFKEDREDSYHFQGWIYGTGTALEFTKHEELELKESLEPIPPGDFIINKDKDKYFIAFDRKGRLGWQENTTMYADQKAHVIEILTEQVTNQYKQYLREKEIPYLIVGERDIDIPLALEKLRVHYGLENLLLGGGGILNWSFLKAGLIDEISLIVAPAVDGNPNDTDLFSAAFSGDSKGIGFTLKSAEVLEGSTLWLKYLINKPIK